MVDLARIFHTLCQMYCTSKEVQISIQESQLKQIEQDCSDYLKSINATRLSESDKETWKGKFTVQSF